ncbi:J7 / DnaJ domain-containing protein / JDP7 [Leishmania donovani]|uniref:Heat_shock_protein-like_protein_-_putative n=3 Tax=Leishmania donovani species complex TaxID=38574 RepID=A0A6L0XN85_LEIIN|nr:putative heat shock protein-like protein [Leishmania infantum JPCM5]XP_003863620.1 heat shock protein-like protein, putative [Leishmania donovani]CAC9525444.1 heat_shock_protein-like_protein_-_putative [Leishmania infantum]AYU81751.1 heat shock protein-like protein, putative [Leishmania donovani]TPP43715.1 DnaJ C terminal domain family protein [Leishmania donovani]TPP47209.1 DnaJ C terminal domain family protein [Leishmania donovani]CAJ1991736.1 J7 / DnaJ domain-containing protein / JDP7 [|eukprot:XP_001467884.1 putative heat shock protein-like protein [Leishmania infantum JPCM5]
MIDYYQFLGLNRQSGDDDVAKAYRRYALAYNPQCHPDSTDQETLQRNFMMAAQAYTVLSDPKKRAIYDIYGEEGVRHGGTGQQGVPGGIDLDFIDPNAVFTRFFGVDNPFQVIGNVDAVKNNQHNFFSVIAGMPPNPPKCPAIEVKLPVTLEDVFYGAMRRAAWNATHAGVPTLDAAVTTTEESYEVRVEKGARTGDHFTVEGRGNTYPGYARGDVVVVVDVMPHTRFRREGDDLVTKADISLRDALCGTTVTVSTMEGRELSILIDEIVDPAYRTRITGEGLPSSGVGDATRGDLIIEFTTKFPSFLTAEQKAEIGRILDAN